MDDSVPNEILPNLYISGFSGALNRTQLNRLKITRVVNCCPQQRYVGNVDEQDCKDGILRLPVDILDTAAQQLHDDFLEQAFQFINTAHQSENRAVLIHCAQGVSRSSSIAIYYLMRHKAITYDAAFALVKGARPIVQPNPNFEAQLRKIETKLRISSSNKQ